MDISLGEYGCREAKGRSLWHIRYLMPPGGATVTFRVTPRGEHTVSLYVLSATGEAVAKAAGTQSAEIHRTLPGGIYYVGIAAAREPGKPDPVFDIEARLDLPAVGDGVGSHARDGSAGTADVTLSAMRALRDGSCPIYTSHAIDVAASRNPVRANKLGVRCKRADGQNADYFTMPVAETQAVRFSLTSADFDPVLLLRDGRGRLLVQKQGSGTVLEQTLQPGMYFVAVSGSTPADSGKYRLEITTTRAKSFLEKACPSWMGLMIVKEGLSGFSLPERTACRLTTGERVVYYSFVAVAPTLLSVRAWSSKFGTRAALLDKNGALLAAHSGQGRGAATVKRELMPGLYYVAISGQGPEAAGFYSLEVKLDNL